MAHANRNAITDVFIDLNGEQIPVEIDKQYRVVETVFKAHRTQGHGSQIDSGIFYHRIVPAFTIEEEPTLE